MGRLALTIALAAGLALPASAAARVRPVSITSPVSGGSYATLTGATPNIAANPQCEIAGIVLEPLNAAGNLYARLLGLGNCGKGIRPKYRWDITVRDRGGLRHITIQSGPTTQIRVLGKSGTVWATFTINYDGASATAHVHGSLSTATVPARQ